MIAHINVNWLSPVKVRTTLIGGEKKMLVWNDLEADEKIKVYDKGVQMITVGQRRLRAAGQLPLRRHVGAQGRTDRSADARKPNYFVDCIDERQTPVQRRRRRAAGGPDARSGRHVRCKERGKSVSL